MIDTPAPTQYDDYADEEFETEPVPQDDLERACLELGHTGSVLELVERDLRRDGYAGSADAALLVYLAATTRILDRPVSVSVMGPSAAGKSHAIKAALRFIPPEGYVELTSMSEKALFYWDEDLSHKMLVVFEQTGIASETMAHALRTLISEGKLRYKVTNPETRRLESLSLDGPTGLITSTTRSVERELATRMLMPTISDSPELTRQIMLGEARRAAGQDLADPADPALHHWIQRRATEDAPQVVIPFAETIALEMNAIATRGRRDLPTLNSLISAHALLHRAARDRDWDGRVIASVLDYEVVYRLVVATMSEAAEQAVPPAIRDTVEAVREISINKGARDDQVTVPQLAKYFGLNRSTISRRVGGAVTMGLLVDVGRGGRGSRRLLEVGDPLPEDRQVLPSPEVVASALTKEPGK